MALSSQSGWEGNVFARSRLAGDTALTCTTGEALARSARGATGPVYLPIFGSGLCHCRFISSGKPVDNQKCFYHLTISPCDEQGCFDYRPAYAPKYDFPPCICGALATEHFRAPSLISYLSR